MGTLYQQDLAYIQAAAFAGLSQGAAPEIIRLLKCALVPIRRVVDVGCGAGALSTALVEAGFDVTGIDPSADLLAIARNAASKAHFIHGSVYETQIPDCEAIVGGVADIPRRRCKRRPSGRRFLSRGVGRSPSGRDAHLRRARTRPPFAGGPVLEFWRGLGGFGRNRGGPGLTDTGKEN
jgi:SAM-dependent methyltransferase